ncbi:MAG: hypothetical protein ACI4MN_05415 [Candidatus Coproplasma sp.]
MIKALIKNEFIKVMRLSGRTKDKKKGLGGFANYLIIMAVLGVLLAAMMFCAFLVMAPVFIENGIGWLCFSYATVMAIVFAVVGSVFMAQSQLYRAKDNDLLLSLPIPSRLILFCRMIPLYVQNLYFCTVVLLPAYIAMCIAGGFSVPGLLFVIIDFLVIPLFTLMLCCLFGFFVAFIASRVKHTNVITVILSLLFFGAYFAVYSQMNTIITAMLENGEQVAQGIMAFAYPLYLVGSSSMGDWLGWLVTFAICTVPFALLYLLLDKTYIGIITRKTSASKAVYKQSMIKRHSLWCSLIGKESKRFFRSTAYLLNCGMGIILLLIAGIYLIVWGRPLFADLANSNPYMMDIIAPMLCIGICMLTSMDGITASSVSLEGKSIAILQSLPVESYKPLYAKVIFHVIFNTPMAVICGILAAVSVNASVLGYFAFILMPVATNVLFGALGIIINLKKPMMDWDNETVVIKQGISTLFLMLAAMLIFGTIAGLFFAAVLFMSGELYLLISTVLLCAGAVGALIWIKKRGAVIWESL